MGPGALVAVVGQSPVRLRPLLRPRARARRGALGRADRALHRGRDAALVGRGAAHRALEPVLLGPSGLRRAPRPVPLGRERAQAPYSEAELAAYLALADAQPTAARRQRASGLIALGAGAGLLGADLRLVTRRTTSSSAPAESWSASAGAARDVVPVRAELAARALGAARWAGTGFIVGGAEPTRRNVTSPLIASLAGGPDLPRLSLARLRSTWLSRCASDIGLATFMAAAGVRCSQRLGDVVAGLDPGDEAAAVTLLGADAVSEGDARHASRRSSTTRAWPRASRRSSRRACDPASSACAPCSSASSSPSLTGGRPI